MGPPRFNENIIDRILSPPYVTANPSVRFVDLEAVWDQKPIVMLYSDGVDYLVNCCRYLYPFRKAQLVASRTIAVLLQDEVDDGVEQLHEDVNQIWW